jgi:hypothetical protein
MRQAPITILSLLVAASLAGGCTALVAGTAGGVAGSELEEDDGRIDPLENTELGEEVYE